jgi:membrane fusion protein, heavy metal efflux system
MRRTPGPCARFPTGAEPCVPLSLSLLGGLPVRFFPRAPSWLRATVAMLVLLAAPPAMAQPSPGDILIRLDERQMRFAGIELGRVEAESGSSDIILPGTVAVPPQGLRVVAAPVGGLVESMEVAPDETVRAGQPIARLRSTELLEAQRLFLEALGAEALAAEKLRRDEALFRDRVIAERRLLTTRADHVFARTTLQEREQMLALLGMTEDAIAELRKGHRLSATLTVVAPVEGTVLGRAAVPGERVAQAAPLFTVAQLDPLWVNLQVPLSRATAVENAARVMLPAQGAEGRVLRVGRSADAATQSVNAVAEITEGAERLRPGQAVSVTVSLRSNGMPQWRVPAGAVVRHRERHWVFVRVPEGFRARPVGVISESAQSVSIRAMLDARDQVAVRGILPLLSELVVADGE